MNPEEALSLGSVSEIVMLICEARLPSRWHFVSGTTHQSPCKRFSVSSTK